MSPRTQKQCFDLHPETTNLLKCVQESHRVLVVLRGVTGSGKTTLARKLAENSGNSAVFSSQNKEQITKLVRDSLHKDTHLVIVDGEHIERNCIKKLAEIANYENYEFFVKEPETPWKYNAAECKKRSSLNESVEEIERKIKEIKQNPVNFDNIIPGGSKNVNIINFHDDIEFPPIPFSSTAQNTSMTSLSTTSSSSSGSTPQMFSMAPAPKTKTMRTCATQVSNENITLESANITHLSPDAGYFFVSEQQVSGYTKGCAASGGLERSVQVELEGLPGEKKYAKPLVSGGKEAVECAQLRALFQQTDIAEIRHYYSLNGLEGCLQLFLLFNEPISSRVVPSDDHILNEELDAIECTIISNQSVEEEWEEHIRMAKVLHFDNSTIDDELIAIIMGSDFAAEHVERSRSAEEQDQQIISLLQAIFSHVEPPEIGFHFEASGRDFEVARALLKESGHVEVNPNAQPLTPHKKKTFSDAVNINASPSFKRNIKKSEDEEMNHFLKVKMGRKTVKLEDVQLDAVRKRKEVDEMRREAMSKGAIAGCAMIRNLAFQDKISRVRDRTTSRVSDIDAKIREAHSNPWNLDLHYMSVGAAIRLVNEAIAAVKYYMRISQKSSNRIQVITGSGNNSRCGAKIKPQVISMLQQQQITFELRTEGCILLKVK